MVKAALKNPHAVIVLALAILVIGLTAISKLPTDILPTFKTPAVQIVTFYPGMPAEVMEKDIDYVNIVADYNKTQYGLLRALGRLSTPTPALVSKPRSSS